MVLAASLMLFLAVAGSGGLPRHTNPSELQGENPSPIQLVTLYGLVINLAFSEKFNESMHTLYDVLKVYAPSNIKYVIERFNELLNQEITLLNKTKTHIILAAKEIDLGYLIEAKKNVDEGWTSLAKAVLTRDELQKAVLELSRSISPLMSRLSTELVKLEELSGKYSKELSMLDARISELQQAKISNTRMFLDVFPRKAWVGSNVQIDGFLETEDGEPLINRYVTIYVENVPVKRITTDGSGRLTGLVELPYLYTPRVFIHAAYIPEGDDVGRYRAAASERIAIELIYVTPVIDAKLYPQRALPLDKVSIQGRVYTDGKHMPSNVLLEAFGQKKAVKLAGDGSFQDYLSVPPWAGDGPHYIRVYTQAEDVVAPSEKSLNLIVYRLSPEIELNVPSIILAGSSAQIKGKLSLPLNSNISIGSFRILVESSLGHSSTYTDEHGGFTVDISVPLTASTSYYQVKVMAYSDDPRFENLSAVENVLAINLIPLSIPVAGFIFLSVWAVSRFRGVDRVSASEKAENEAKAEKEAYAVTDIEDIPSAYMYCVRLLENRTGIRMKRSDTIREYLNKVSNRLSEGERVLFQELSLATEAYLYGGLYIDLNLVIGIVRRLEGVEG